MPNTRSSSLREIIIDRCLSGTREMTLKEILGEVNKELEARNMPVVRSKVTILQDIYRIGENVKIDEVKRGKYVYYKYNDPGYSIYTAGLDPDFIMKVQQAIDDLELFRGRPNCEWVDELSAVYYVAIHTCERSKGKVKFSCDPHYHYIRKYLNQLVEIIRSKKVIELTYHKFVNDKAKKYVVHPFQIRNYENRWYLVGSVDHHPESISCFALERIVDIRLTDIPYHECTLDLDEYFSLMVGLTIEEGTEPQDVLLWVKDSDYPYLEANPIHQSQQYVCDRDGGKVVHLHLYINRDLVMRIMGSKVFVGVLAPKDFRQMIADKYRIMVEMYK